MIKAQFRTAIRHIFKNKGYSLINILGLSLGICACLSIYLIVHFELSFDTFHTDRQRIYRIINERRGFDQTVKDAAVPPPLPIAARQTIPGLAAVAGYHVFEAHVNHFPTTKSTILTDAQYFSIFRYRWLAGSPAIALNDPFRVVLTESSARRYFGDRPFSEILGRPLTFNDSLIVYVSGIVRDWSGNTDFPFTAFISPGTIDRSFLKDKIHPDQWGDFDFPWTSRAFVKLNPDANPDRIAKQLSALAGQKLHLEKGTTVVFSLQSLANIHFDASVADGITKGHRPTLYILMGIALFILLLAIVNFINLSTAMSLHRVREIGIRKVLGSLRSSLTFQFLAETGVLTGIAVLIALLLVNPMLLLFHSMLPKGLAFHLFAPDLWLFLIFLTVTTTLLAGFYPARIISSWRPVLCLKGTAATKTGDKAFLRKGLIIFQFTISLVFIISSLIIEHQISYMRNEELGFSTDAVLNIQTDLSDTTYRTKVLAEKMRQLPGVSMVARESFDPITDFHTTIPVQYRGKKATVVMAAMQIGDSNFIPLYGIKLLAGTNIRHQDSLREVVINETLSKTLGFPSPRDAVGKLLWVGETALPILGVVGDFHEYNYREAIRPVIIADIPQPETMLAVKLGIRGRHPEDLKKLLSAMQTQYKIVYPERPFAYHFLDDAIAQMYSKEEQTAFLMRAAVIATIFISCIGLFGLAMFSARQRTKEIGIRKVLGATGIHIITLLSRTFLALIGIAAVIASPIAWLCMHFWLQNFVYRASIPGWIFVLAASGAFLAAFVTILFQTLKAAFINPVEALRNE